MVSTILPKSQTRRTSLGATLFPRNLPSDYHSHPLELDAYFSLHPRRLDLVGRGVSRLLKRSPQIPGRNRAIRPPSFAKFLQLLRPRHVLLPISHGPAFLYSQIVNRQHVGPPQSENQ